RQSAVVDRRAEGDREERRRSVSSQPSRKEQRGRPFPGGTAVSRHAEPPPPADTPPVPEPTYAERARTLAHVGRVGTLATVSRRHPGHPFASVMPYALDGAGRPVVLISSMAMHTQNLQADPRASLLVTQPGWSGDPLAAARLTLMGEGHVVPAEETKTARGAYLARHERAAYWVDFED